MITSIKTILGLCLLGSLGIGLASAADSKADDRPFNGKNLEGWKPKSGGTGSSKWEVGAAHLDPANPKRFLVRSGGKALINNAVDHGQSVNLSSETLYGDANITLEVMVPKGSNSGIYLMGEYEVQVLDSHGRDKNPGPADMGAIYDAQPPKNPKYKAPGEWNSYEIQWQAPRFDSTGTKIANARFLKVILNGVTIHENVEMVKATPGGLEGKEKARGPLMFQGDHGPVAYRNIRIRPL